MIERLHEFPDDLELNTFNSPEGSPRIRRESRRASAACRMREPADAVLMPLSCAACSRIAYDAGGRSIVTRVALAISCHPLPRYQLVTLSLPCPSSDDTRFLAHSSSCSCSAVISPRFGPPRTGHGKPASAS